MPQSNIKTKPWCPFCGQTIAKPRPPENRKLGEFSVGSCQCGAVYTCDPTGFNVGAAMVECIVYSCNDDWDLAWDMIPETDYLTERLENYDEITNQVVEARNLDGRSVKGVIFFVRLHRDIDEVTRLRNKEGATGPYQTKSTIPVLEPERDPKRKKKRADKTAVQKMVESGDIDGLVDLSFDDFKTLRFMQRILYTPDDNLRWKTVHVLGKVCARLSTRKPGKVSDLLHRLFAACSDSASSSWGGVETIGAVISERPDIYGAFMRHLLEYLHDQRNRPLVLWSLGTVAANRPDLVRGIPFYQLFSFLDDPDPLCRALALRLFGRIKAKEIRNAIKKMTTDTTSITIYEEGDPVKTTVGDLATEALASIDTEGESEK
ncbi:DVU0298 family protein [Thermodesulfobacteriota bacterium]